MGYRAPIMDSLQWEGSLKMYLVGALAVILAFGGAGYAVGRMGNK
jgi:hypothetical protein